MREYQFDQKGYYVGESENPGSTPSHNCTFTAPVLIAGYIPKWNGSAWNQVENHRGEKGYVNGVETEITEYGPYPEGWSDTPPPPTLEEAKEKKLKEISDAKWAAIEGGEVEYAELHYATDEGSQGMMNRALSMHQLTGVLPPFWKAKDGIIQNPTIEQLTAISTAMYDFMEAQFSRELELATQVNAATTVEQVEVISWTLS
jgi:hypothetical protein